MRKTESVLQKYVRIDLNVAEWLNYSNIEKFSNMFYSTKLLEEIFNLASLSQNRNSHPFTFCFQKTKNIFHSDVSYTVKSLFLVQNNYKMVTAGLSFLKIFQ